jgi:FixJ family two-component response regulator
MHEWVMKKIVDLFAALRPPGLPKAWRVLAGRSLLGPKAGASDFLPKPVRDVDRLRAVELALERARLTYSSRCEADALRQRFDRLTPREREVMALIVTGRLNKQVASELGTAEKTIKIHLARDGENGSHIAGAARPHRRQGRYLL